MGLNDNTDEWLASTTVTLDPGDGYILSSSNSIHSAVKPENYVAMLDTLKKCGTYPVEL